MGRKAWSPEKVALFTRLWSEGASPEYIARQFGLTVGSVYSKASSLELKRRKSGRRKGVGVFVSNPPQHKVEPNEDGVSPAHTQVHEGKVSLMGLRGGECRWPLGDPKDPGFGFCGDHAVKRKSYCAMHMAAAYVPMPKRDQNPAESELLLEKDLRPPRFKGKGVRSITLVGQ